MQECGSCGWLAYPPTNHCSNCLADAGEFRWTPVSGRGRLKTWTVMQQAFLPGFDEDIPYVVGDIELVEQSDLRMVGRVVGIEAAELSVGLDMAVTFDDVAAGIAIPQFTPVRP
jgi:uncharacterized OB-fold protein